MKPLLKVMFSLAALFAFTFILGRVFGLLTLENVRYWFESAQSLDPLWVFALVVSLLFLDLFVAVPTLSITILAGYFLGFKLGALSAFTGMTLAAFSGYAISYVWGERGVAFLVRDEQKRKELNDTFYKSGPLMIMLSRAAPIITEVTACMAGATKMKLRRYAFFFSIGTLPYVLIATYAGSVSSLESPKPAIFGAVLMSLTMWVGWVLFQTKRRPHNP